MKRLIILILAALLIKDSQAQNAKATSSDSTQIRKTIMGFYDWYLRNPARLNSFELYRGIKTKDEPPYKIDWKEAERYFAFIRSSVPQLGEEFIKNQRMFLKKCDSAFKVDTEDDVPYGFDYDWYTNSQEEPSYLVDELKKSPEWKIKINKAKLTADVSVMGHYLGDDNNGLVIVMCYTMKKEGGKWKIAGFECSQPSLSDIPPPPMQELKQ